MENERTKTYEEFKEEVRSRNFILFIREIWDELKLYSGKEIHDVSKTKGVLNTYLYLHRKKSKTANLEGTVQEVMLSGRERGPNESLLRSLYNHWKKGTYNI